jgi:hypothetical protein
VTSFVDGHFTYDALGFFLKLYRGGMIPPLVDVADVVELPALVVEAVRDLVAYDHANPAKVQALWEELVIEWRLQNAGRKH